MSSSKSAFLLLEFSIALLFFVACSYSFITMLTHCMTLLTDTCHALVLPDIDDAQVDRRRVFVTVPYELRVAIPELPPLAPVTVPVCRA